MVFNLLKKERQKGIGFRTTDIGYHYVLATTDLERVIQVGKCYPSL